MYTMPEYIRQLYPQPPAKPDYPMMTRACMEALETHPEDREHLLTSATIFLQRAGLFDKGIEHARKYLPTLTDEDCIDEVHRFLIYCLEASGDVEGALAEAEIMIKKSNKHSSFVFDDAIRMAKLLKKDDKVIELTALEIEAQGGLVDMEVYKEMAEVYDKKKEYMLSHEYYVKAAQAEYYESYWLWNNAGRALALAGKEEEAMFYFQMVLKLYPKSEIAHYFLGQIYQTKKDVYRALHHYTEALKIKPDFPEVHNNLAAISFEEESDIQEAINYLEKALGENPSPQILTLLYTNLSRMYKKIADYDKHEYYKGKLFESLGFDVEWKEGDEDEDEEGDDVSLN
jgi:tetratricopeptide (TPR) repeat protein